MSKFMNYEIHVDILQRKGLIADSNNVKSYQSGDFPGGMVCSPDPTVSHISPRFITINDVDELKEICGINDSLFTEGGLDYNEHIPPPVHELGYEVIHANDTNLCKAVSAYLTGNSQSVSTWKDTINKFRFPLNVTGYDFDTLTVQAGHPVTFLGTDQQPFGVHGNTLIIEPNGQVITNGPGTMTVKTVESMQTNKLSAFAEADQVVNLVSLGGDAGKSGTGGNGPNPGPGTPGTPAVDHQKNACTPAGPGGPGLGGKVLNATDGPPGGWGGDANVVSLNYGTMNGSYIVGSVGGNGAKGGTGGDGGKGGDGGPGGAASAGQNPCSAGPQGPGGDGGKAGSGGIGGNGGNGKRFFLNYTGGNPVISITTQKANAGDGGDPGKPGAKGLGIPNGVDGATGSGNTGGTGGSPGEIIINGKSIGT